MSDPPPEVVRAIVVVRSGPAAGRPIVIECGRSVRIGRDARADVVIAGDERLSGLHLELRCDRDGVQVRDLGSTNGTLLRGHPVGEARADHGDEIVAGDTCLGVELERARPRGEAPAPVSAWPLAEQSCPSGLLRVWPRGAEPPGPEEAADRLAARSGLFLLAGPGASPPSGGEAAEPLFDDLPPEASPRLVDGDAATVLAWVGSLWGSDDGVVLLSAAEPATLAGHLREALRRAGPPDSLLGLHVPSLLEPQLVHGDPEATSRLLEGIDAVLLDDPVRHSWQLFARPAWIDALAGLGFARPPAAGPEASA